MNEEQTEETIKTAEAKTRLTESFREANARSPELMVRIAENSMQLDENGELQNAEAILHEFKQSFPEQFSEQTKPVGIDGGAGSATFKPLTREILAKMKPADIAKLDWQAVRSVLENKR
jgi:hypothetical protein